MGEDDRLPNERLRRRAKLFREALDAQSSAVPTVEALSEAEREALCICPWDTSPPLPESTHTSQCSQHRVAVERILAARAAAPDALRVRIEALAAEFGECWVTRSEVRCTGFIGGTFNNGGEWVEAMCCLPCRLRALLEDGAQ